MFTNKFSLKIIAVLSAVIILTTSAESIAATKTKNAVSQPIALDIYKSPTCRCCAKWISHIEDNGFISKVHNYQNISIIKEKKGIQPNYRSCHTAISKNGFVFEGHIPAKFIQQFLNEKHPSTVIGLSVPSMPMGSPGMEYEDKIQPYNVLLLKSDGTSEIYASVKSHKDQH